MWISFRRKLILSFVLVIAATGGVATVVGALMIGDRFVKQAQAKVAQDINSARVLFEHEVDRIRNAVRMTGDRPSIREAVCARNTAVLTELLEMVRRNEDLDLMGITDGKGTVLVRSHPDALVGDNLAGTPLIWGVLSSGLPLAGTLVISGGELGKESGELAARALIRLVKTPHASPTEREEETSGMVLIAGAPIISEDGGVAGVVYGGKLVNRQNDLVDRIMDTVYRGEIYEGREIGTATLFLGDVRIATSVRTSSGERAIGTRIQAEVGDAVLRQGRSWGDRAFVVNGWYLTAYEPIRDLAGAVVGILYVGMREDKFLALRQETVLAFLGVTGSGILLAGLIAFLLARGVLKPIRRLVLGAREISAGNFDHHVPEVSRDEIGSLERAFNRMTAAIRERDQQLKADTEARIIRSARFASLGQLAASVAHEVNNPLTGVLTYLRLMLRFMTKKPFPMERLEEMVGWVRSMEEETARCGRLVSGMLQLGREPVMRILPHDVNALIEKSVLLLDRRFVLGNVEVARKLDMTLPQVECDGDQIQQTIMGLLLNAFEAMRRGGLITVESKVEEGGRGVSIRVSDQGVGIRAEDVPKLFEAFYTTKGDKGIGLGLSIAQAIVKRHGGAIEVESEVGRGSSFTVKLPLRRGSLPGGEPPRSDTISHSR